MRANQFFVALLALVALSSGVLAQTDAGNGVARVSFIRGDVTIQRGDSGDLTEAAINAPLVTGDRILTGPNARAEVQFDYAHFVRLSSNTELRMQDLKQDRYLIAVAEGTAGFSRVEDYNSDVEVNTPSISVRPAKRGEYRVSVYPDGTTEITVREGQAEIFSPAGVQRLGKNRTMLVRGDAANPEFQTVAELRKDDFDQWNRDRDKLIRKSNSYQYVDRSIPGAYDLDAYGGWVNVAPYGYVWRPRVAVGWAPYRHGRWAWADYYGWTWVSTDPWGWAPYHYGRWFNSPGYGWCWWPGGSMRHYYSPAVVGFVGFQIGGVGIGVGFGNVGWVPLAPYEPFHRWWGGGWNSWYGGGYRNNRTYVDNSVNIVNNVNITNVYRNARVNNGVTVVNGDSFRRGGSVNPIRVSSDTLRRGNLVEGRLPLTPERGSLQYSNRTVNRAQVENRLAGTQGRQFYSRATPSRAERPSFDTQRAAMERVEQRAFGRGSSVNGTAGRGGASPAGSGVTASPSRGGATGRGDSATRGVVPGRAGNGLAGGETAGLPAQGAAATRGATATRGQASPGVTQRGAVSARQETDRGGWRRFGEPVNRGTSGVTAGTRLAEPATGARGGAAASGSSTDNSSWRRFGEPAGRGAATSRPGGNASGTAPATVAPSTANPRTSAPAARGEANGGWRSFGAANPSRSASSPDTGGSSRGAVQRNASDTPSRSTPRAAGSGASSIERGSSSSSPERVRVNPSIVRERGSGGSSSVRGASGASGSSSGSGRGAASGRGGGGNRSSVDSSDWRRFSGGAASGIEVTGEPSSRTASRASTLGSRGSADRDAFSRNSGAASASSAGRSGGNGSTFGARSSAGSSPSSSARPSYSSSGSSRGSYSSPSRGVSSTPSRSSAPSYSAPSRSSGSFGGSSRPSSRGISSSRSSSSGGGGISRGGSSGISRGSGSVSRGGGGGVSRGGGRGGRN